MAEAFEVIPKLSYFVNVSNLSYKNIASKKVAN